MDREPSRSLLVAGVLLVLLGMVLGAALPAFTNPRMALSSHQQGIVAGSLLALFGLIWPFAGLVGRRALLTRRLLIAGAYAIWIGTVLAAVFGTSRATPIVGAGYAGARWQEIGVSLVLMVGSLAAVFGVASLFIGLWHRGRDAEGSGS